MNLISFFPFSFFFFISNIYKRLSECFAADLGQPSFLSGSFFFFLNPFLGLFFYFYQTGKRNLGRSGAGPLLFSPLPPSVLFASVFFSPSDHKRRRKKGPSTPFFSGGGERNLISSFLRLLVAQRENSMNLRVLFFFPLFRWTFQAPLIAPSVSRSWSKKKRWTLTFHCCTYYSPS